MGYQVPPGISDATVPNPIFNLTPAATVDEGNNWINMSWGPLTVTSLTLLPEQSPAAPLTPTPAASATTGFTGPSSDRRDCQRESERGAADGLLRYDAQRAR